MSPSPQLLAACSALLFAGSHIASKRGVLTTSVVGGLVISLSVGLVTLVVAVMVNPPATTAIGPIAVFAAAGLLGPGVGRAGAVAGVDRLGPSISVPLQASVYPLFAVAAAALVLRESVGSFRITGALAIVVGVWVLSRRGDGPPASDLADIGIEDRIPRRSTLRAGLSFPLVAGLGYAAADVVRKEGLGVLEEPTFGALIGVATALIAWLAALLTSSALRARIKWGPTAGWFAVSGLLASLALLSQFYALRTGDVSVVSPIVAAQPLAVLVLSALFLGGVERLTNRTLMGAVTIVLGTLLVSI